MDRTDFTLRDWKQDKNQINPLERMEGGTQRTGEFLPRIGRISPVGEGMDQKVCCFPQAYALAARCVCSAMKASFPVCPSTSVWSAHRQTGNQQNKIAALGSTKCASIGGYGRLPQTCEEPVLTAFSFFYHGWNGWDG